MIEASAGMGAWKRVDIDASIATLRLLFAKSIVDNKSCYFQPLLESGFSFRASPQARGSLHINCTLLHFTHPFSYFVIRILGETT